MTDPRKLPCLRNNTCGWNGKKLVLCDNCRTRQHQEASDRIHDALYTPDDGNVDEDNMTMEQLESFRDSFNSRWRSR